MGTARNIVKKASVIGEMGFIKGGGKVNWFPGHMAPATWPPPPAPSATASSSPTSSSKFATPVFHYHQKMMNCSPCWLVRGELLLSIRKIWPTPTLCMGLVLPQFHAIQLKLDRSNYAFWRALVHSAIRAHGFDEFISATAEVPAPLIPGRSGDDMVPNPEFVTWIRRDQFLLSWMLSVGESMLGHVVRRKSSREVWSALETVFHSHSKAQVSQYRVQLQSTKKGAMTVEDYFMKMRGIADQLAAIGKSLDDDELLQYILSGFGPEYESLVVNTMQRTDVSNLKEIQLAFQAYEVRLAQQQSSLFDHSANVAYRRGNGGQGYGQNVGQSSGGRGQVSGAQSFGRGAPRPNFGGKVLMCQLWLCGRSGHVALRCFKRFDIHFTGNDSAMAGCPTSGSAGAPKAFVTDFVGTAEHGAGFTDGEGNWFVDSGATTHVTNEFGNLSVSSQYNGNKNLIVGNGQVLTQDPAEGESN